jgi:hypothetical protein
MVWCWWCCHPFENESLGMPVSYDPKHNHFKTFGHFCSFSCMKAYNHYENLSQKNMQYALISLMYSQSNPQRPFHQVICAPPRQCLKEFGGSMDIREFRTQTDIHDLQLPPMVRLNHVIDKQQTNWIRSTQTPIETIDYATKGNRVTNNAIKIKPNMKKMNTLDSVLGIFPNTE